MSSLPNRGVGWLRQILVSLPALIPLAIIAAMIAVFVKASNIATFQPGVFFGSVFNPATETFGVFVMIVGSFLTAVPALALALLIALGVGITSAVYLPRWLGRTLDPFVDLLAGIPSVVIGLWAYIIVAPFFETTLTPALAGHLGFVPGFGPPPSPGGLGLPLAVFVLTLMILPITTVLVRDALRTVPKELWESGLALGATRWEVVRRISLRHGARGIWAAGLIGFARAIGEAVAVSMVIGSTFYLPNNAYGTTNTMPALLIQQFDEAQTDPILLTTLVEVAFLLMAITLAVNLLGRFMMRRLAIGGVPL